VKLRILGGGWYGCHLALALSKEHEVELHEIADDLFAGASGNQPARLHLGFHYPRSKLTRAACQDHYRRFMSAYGHLTRGVPINIYAIADHTSLVDFGNYRQTLKDEVEFVTIEDPTECGLRNVEGALLTGERHVVIREARAWFKKHLGNIVKLNVDPNSDEHRYDFEEFDQTIDCTFCARGSDGVDRYEPCFTVILEGPTSKAVTIMDGQFPSLYPWDEDLGLCSLSSASLTPFTKDCKTYEEAKARLRQAEEDDLEIGERVQAMVAQMEYYYPAVRKFEYEGYRLAVRAMPLSGADARLVDIVRQDTFTLRVRASKLDAIFYAEDMLREQLRKCSR
jgi:hypothetical protein